MSATWDITLERRINREEFDSACSEIGLLPNGDIYYDARVGGQDLAFLNLGGVEVYFGKESESDSLVIRSSAAEKRYEAMKRTALDLGERLPFKDISGEWFYDITEFDEATGNYKPIPYSADVFNKIE